MSGWELIAADLFPGHLVWSDFTTRQCKHELAYISEIHWHKFVSVPIESWELAIHPLTEASYAAP